MPNAFISDSSIPFIVGRHPTIERILALVRKVTAADATVLVTGESGTGKEIIARAIHALSPRSAHPFVPVNCGAIPSELLESEMFGHVRGAFTGAVGARAGLFQAANGGTIFLDEVGELSLRLQVKLLRVLQDREIRPVGADRAFKVDVRVIAATNKNLEQEVTRGTFREDLFYRLQVIPITLPPLRERRSDIPLLIAYFLEKYRAKGREPVQFTDDAILQLWEYDWPGNIRELENLVERLAILSDDGWIKPEDLPSNIRSFISESRVSKPTLDDQGFELNAAVESFERQLIEEAIRRTKGNKKAAARLLGMRRTTLLQKIKRHAADADPIDEYAVATKAERDAPLFRPYLEALSEGGTTPTEVARKLGFELSSVSRTLKALRAAGLVVIDDTHAGDRRAKPHLLTSRGIQLFKQLTSDLRH